MVIAEYTVSDAGVVLSREIPRLDEGEKLLITRCSYRGSESLLLEVLSETGGSVEAVVFPGLIGGVVPVELVRV